MGGSQPTIEGRAGRAKPGSARFGSRPAGETPNCCARPMQPQLAHTRDSDRRSLIVTLWRCRDPRAQAARFSSSTVSLRSSDSSSASRSCSSRRKLCNSDREISSSNSRCRSLRIVTSRACSCGVKDVSIGSTLRRLGGVSDAGVTDTRDFRGTGRRSGSLLPKSQAQRGISTACTHFSATQGAPESRSSFAVRAVRVRHSLFGKTQTSTDCLRT